MSEAHRIRLEGFWKPLESGDGVSRSFGRPRTIDDDEIVEVVGHCTAAYELFVNTERIGEALRDGTFRWPIPMPLKPRNVIIFKTQGDVTDAAMEIRRVTPPT